MAKTPKAQYEKLITVSAINIQAKLLLEAVDIPLALSYSPEPSDVWANMAREAAVYLIALADKINPPKQDNNSSPDKNSSTFALDQQDQPGKARRRPRGIEPDRHVLLSKMAAMYETKTLPEVLKAFSLQDTPEERDKWMKAIKRFKGTLNRSGLRRMKDGLDISRTDL